MAVAAGACRRARVWGRRGHPVRQRLRPAVAGMVGCRREGTALMTSLGSILQIRAGGAGPVGMPELAWMMLIGSPSRARSTARDRDGPRGGPVGRDPAAYPTRKSRNHVGVAPRDRQLRDHRHRPRQAGADDQRDRWPFAALTDQAAGTADPCRRPHPPRANLMTGCVVCCPALIPRRRGYRGDCWARAGHRDRGEAQAWASRRTPSLYVAVSPAQWDTGRVQAIA